MSTRLSVNISNDTARVLRDLAERNETSVTDIIRRAVSVYKLVEDEVAEGKTVQIVDREENEVVTLALV
jgi:predicted transcriptional regulator